MPDHKVKIFKFVYRSGVITHYGLAILGIVIAPLLYIKIIN